MGGPDPPPTSPVVAPMARKKSLLTGEDVDIVEGVDGRVVVYPRDLRRRIGAHYAADHGALIVPDMNLRINNVHQWTV